MLKLGLTCLALCVCALAVMAAELSNGDRLKARNASSKAGTYDTAVSDVAIVKGRTSTWETASTVAGTAASDLTIVKGRTSTWETAATDASVVKGRTQTWENAASTVSGGSYGMVLIFGSNVTFNGAGGYILVTNLPTSAAGLAPGRLWLGNFAAGAAVTNALCVAP
jgi:hypothetical protein